MTFLAVFAASIFIHFTTISCETNQFNATEATISTHNTSGLYGYDISLQKINGEASLMIGAPPSSPQTGSGSLRKCNASVSTGLSTSMSLQCSSVPRVPQLVNNNIGQRFSTDSRTPAVLACSTTSIQNCTNMRTLPGYCYLVDTASTTPIWKILDHTSTRGCPKPNTVDVLFVLDGSGSLGEERFIKIKDWTVEVTDILKVNEGIAKVAVMQFGRYATMEINFNSNSKLRDLQSVIRDISYRRGLTYTVDALREAERVFRNSTRFNNADNSQVMIILTDGGSSQTGVLGAANNLRNMGVATYAVGVGRRFNKKELRELATGTVSDDRVYEVTNFDNLDKIVNSLQQQIESFIPNEGTGNLTTEFAQAGMDVALSKNRTVQY